MRYYLDCEFNGFGGNLLSLALVTEHGDEFYIARDQAEMEAEARSAAPHIEPWVRDNVLPVMDCEGASPMRVGRAVAETQEFWPTHIEPFLLKYGRHEPPHIIADWPDDIAYLCRMLITGPGYAIRVPGMTFEWSRVDSYPTDLAGAIQHNALWDARALRRALRRPVSIE